MSARFLHVFTDENPELQRQIGCMTGIFQMFDRQYVLKGRRISHSQKRHSSGHGLSTSASLGAEHDASSPRIDLEKRLTTSVNENQRISMESSSTSFSSTSYSSFSSLEYGKSCQQEPLPFDRTIFLDKPSKRSPELKTSNADGQPPCHDPCTELPNSSVHTASRSLDFRDAVKETIKRNSHGLSVSTSPEQELTNHALKHRDSPRPLQVSRSTDGSYVVGINGKSREPVDGNESIRVLVKLKEAPWDFSEFGESPRMFEGKAGSFYPEQRDAHRYSYDGRERLLQSLDSREDDKLPREPPRLSLDSRQGSQRNSKLDSRPTSIFNDLDGSNSNQRVTTASNLEQGLVSHKRSTSVVAKLMGLEAMPSLRVVTQDPVYISNNCDPSKGQKPKSLNASQEYREDFLSSPKRYIKNSVNPGIKDRDSKMKPISNAKVLIQPAPWGQQEKQSVPQKVSFTHQEAPVKQRHESVYSEIEKRLKELEFRQSKKDLRALQQIVDAMQGKGLLETKKGDQETIKGDQSLISAGMKNQKTMPSLPAVTKGTAESPIIIMKPANSVKRSRLPPSSVIHLEGLSGVQKLQTRSTMDRRKAFTNQRVANGKNSNARSKDNVSHKVHSETVQVSSKPQQSPREDGGSSLKISGSPSPKLRQKRLEAPLPSSDLCNPRRVLVNSKPAESVSPRSKLTQKPAQVKDRHERLSKSSETRNSSCQGDEISQRSDSNLSFSSQLDIEGTIADRSVDNSVSQQSSRSPSGKAARKAASAKRLKKPSVSSSKEVSRVEFVTAAPEQPRPISVPDTSFYQDDWTRSPSKKNSNSPKDEKYLTSDDPWTPSTLHDIRTTSSGTEVDQKKLLSIEKLVQKLSVLSSSDDWPSPRDHIASICETQNPDRNYMSEMGTMPVQLHPSGHPINPDLFLILEQMKTGWLPSSGTLNSNTLQPKTDQVILHKKLMSDIVNEVLIQKLELTSSDPRPDHFIRSRKLTCRFPNGQQLLNELCLEIEKLQADIPGGENCDVEIKISNEEVLCRSDGWADFDKEVPGLVLEMERLVFKDLIDEIVSGEAVPVAQSKASRRKRQLFGK